MVGLALRVVGRAIFGDDVARAGDVLDSAFPVLNRHTFRRAMSPLAPPASWPTPDNRRAASARRALYEVVDALIAHLYTLEDVSSPDPRAASFFHVLSIGPEQ